MPLNVPQLAEHSPLPEKGLPSDPSSKAICPVLSHIQTFAGPTFSPKNILSSSALTLLFCKSNFLCKSIGAVASSTITDVQVSIPLIHPISIYVMPGTGVASGKKDAYSQEVTGEVDAIRAGHGKRLHWRALENKFLETPYHEGLFRFVKWGKARVTSAAHPYQWPEVLKVRLKKKMFPCRSHLTRPPAAGTRTGRPAPRSFNSLPQGLPSSPGVLSLPRQPQPRARVHARFRAHRRYRPGSARTRAAPAFPG